MQYGASVAATSVLQRCVTDKTAVVVVNNIEAVLRARCASPAQEIRLLFTKYMFQTRLLAAELDEDRRLYPVSSYRLIRLAGRLQAIQATGRSVSCPLLMLTAEYFVASASTEPQLEPTELR